MAFIFPEDKADFTAPNGVTYRLGRHQMGHQDIQG